MKVTVTAHAKFRINERIEKTNPLYIATCSKKEREKMATTAKKKGMTRNEYFKLDKNSELRKYLSTKGKKNGGRIILYQKHIFIFDNTHNKLVTIYAIPERFHLIYDSFIRESTNSNILIHLRDRNTNEYKPFLYFRNEVKAQDFVYNFLKSAYYDKYLEEQRWTIHTKKSFFDYLKQKKICKFTTETAIEEEEMARQKQIAIKLLKNINITP